MATDRNRIRLMEQPGQVPCRQPAEFLLQIASPRVDNPFVDLRCEAVFTAPSGKTVRVLGFCDSDDGSLVRLRFCPAEAGRYSYSLRCGDAAGEAVFQGELASRPSVEKGFIRVDPDHPRHFRFDDGSFAFLAGKTAWLLGSSALWREFLDLCVQQRQNVVRFALGDMYFRTNLLRCRWWAESNAGPDRTRYYLRLWRQLDQAIQYGAARGLLFEVCFFGHADVSHAEGFPIPHPPMERFWDYALARLAAYPSVLLWQLFNEYTKQGGYQEYMAGYLRGHDPYNHIVATSGQQVGDIPFPESDWNDVVIPHFCTGSDRDLHDFYRSWALRLRSYGKPVFIDETGRTIASQGNSDGERRRKQYWIWAMSGVYSNFHSKGGCYVDLTLEPGEQYWPHLVSFWQTTSWYRMQPADDLIRGSPAGIRAAYALEAEGEIVVYLYCDEDTVVTAGMLTLEMPAGTWWAHWYDPKTGQVIRVDILKEAATPRALPVPDFRSDLALQLLRWDY